MHEWIAPFLTTEGLVALLTLTVLEIVLGIDNVVFIAVLCGKLPPDKRVRTGRLGIMMAVVTRVLLLFAITWLVSLDKHALFTIAMLNHDFTAKDLVLLVGGLFLLYKSTTEIHGKMTGEGSHLPGDPASDPAAAGAAGVPGAPAPSRSLAPKAATVASVVVQIMLIDIVFSIDSVITAAGMVKDIQVMVVAVLLSATVMMTFAKPIMAFVDAHPTIKVLALSFLVLIGTMLVAESCGQHIPKGYIYFAMAFSLVVEIINMKVRSKAVKKAGHPAA